MAIQRIRADRPLAPSPNGATEWVADWLGGAWLAKITRCPIGDTTYWTTVYIHGFPDTFFTQPAAIQIRGRTVKGFITRNESGPRFHPNHF